MSPSRPLPSGGAGASQASGPAPGSPSGPSAPLASSGDPPLASAPATTPPASGGPARAETEPSSAEEEGEEGGEEDEEEGEEDEEEDEEDEEEEGAPKPGASRARPAPQPGDGRKAVVRFALFFMGFLGLYMLIDPNCWSNPPGADCSRIEIANALGLLLQPALGFGGQHILLTMFLAAALEMAMSAVAYHATTDWIETARVQKHNAAIRPLWMKALRSGKKDRVAALKPHMDALNVRQSRVTINQLKGMVITWVLLIAIYTWVGLFISSQAPSVSLQSNAHNQVVPLDHSVLLYANATHGEPGYVFNWTLTGPSTVQGPRGDITQWAFPPSSGLASGGPYQVSVVVTDAHGSIASASSTFYIAYLGANWTAPAGPASNHCVPCSVDYFGAETNLLTTLGPFPLWFLSFSLYTFPLNMIFRRYLKHAALSTKLDTLPPPSPPAAGSPPLP